MDHEHAVAHDDHDSPEAIKKEIRKYLIVCGALFVLTVVTVWLCFGLQMPVHTAIAIGLLVASVKAFLVAGFFMHLLNEKRLIYGVLILTVAFFFMLMWGPWHNFIDSMSHIGK